MNEVLTNMMRGLALHYLHRRTVEEAIEQGRAGGVPEELLASLPDMMFSVTSAAGAIFGEGFPFDEVVDELTQRALASGNAEDFGREDAAALVRLTIEFLAELCGDDEKYRPLPDITEPWYQYAMTRRPTC